MDAHGVISKDERNNFIGRVRTMASSVAKLYVEQRKAMGFPLCKDNCHSELGSESICKR